MINLTSKLTTEEVIKRCIKKHGNKYSYDRVHYKGFDEKIEIGCKIHGYFFQNAYTHYKLGVGCPYCANNVKLTKDEFIKRANLTHNNFYNYDKVDFVDCLTKVLITCPIHGDFFQLPKKHIFGDGCPKCAVLKRKNTMLKKYGVEHALQSEDILNKMVNQVYDKYGVTNIMYDEIFKNKVSKSKIINKSYCTSKTEELVYKKLCNIFGFDDVIRQYTDLRYPFNCDFYIISRDMFIELNAFWSHGGHWYDDSNILDNQKADFWKNKNSKLYNNCYKVWTYSDVKKRQIASLFGLNYVVFWCNNLSDFNLWVASGCPDGFDYISEYSWY